MLVDGIFPKNRKASLMILMSKPYKIQLIAMFIKILSKMFGRENYTIFE